MHQILFRTWAVSNSVKVRLLFLMERERKQSTNKRTRWFQLSFLQGRKCVAMGLLKTNWFRSHGLGREETAEVGRGQLLKLLEAPVRSKGFVLSQWSPTGRLRKRGRTLEGRRGSILSIKKVIPSCREQIWSRGSHWDVSVTEQHRLMAYKTRGTYSWPFWRLSFQKPKVTRD